MEGTWGLILLSLVMLLGSYLAGSIPLNVSMSEEKLEKISVFGAGLLVGTALAVIIPEGVRALLAVGAGGGGNCTAPAAAAAAQHAAHIHQDIHTVIGLSLVLGFVFMLVVDQVSARRGGGGGGGRTERSVTATVGLVVHAAADGVALGAAATTAQADVELLVFLAIMLHKAPAAFGLVTFLLSSGLDRGRIRRHLLIFSCAAPALALATFFGIGDDSKHTLSHFNATGIAMLFSAGTFLYVATVHVLPTLTHAHAHSHTHALLPGGAGAGAGGDGKSGALPPGHVALLALAATLPAALALFHHH